MRGFTCRVCGLLCGYLERKDNEEKEGKADAD